MLGSFRFLLALIVAANHIWPPVESRIGGNAVAIFYVMSGFLVTRSFCVKYANSGNGLASYAISRFTRVYPTYLLALVLSLPFAVYAAGYTLVPSQMGFPLTFKEIISNLTLWTLYDSKKILVPPAWFLSVTLFFYCFLPFLGRSFKIVVVWFMASLLFVAYAATANLSFYWRYTHMAGASIFFSAGSLGFYLRRRWTMNISPILNVAFITLTIAVTVMSATEGFTFKNLYLSGLIGAIFCFLLPRLPDRLAKIDRFLGDMSYPIFLFHYLGATIANFIIGNMSRPQRTFGYFVFSMIITAAFIPFCLWCQGKVEKKVSLAWLSKWGAKRVPSGV